MPPSTSAPLHEIFDPRGEVRTEQRALAPRLGRLDGARLTVLDNSKWNAGALLRAVVEELQHETPLESVDWEIKDSFSKVAGDSQLREIADRSDIALTAIGD